MKNEFKDKIDNANVYDAALRTPLEKQINLSKRFDNNILLKREDLQPVFSFKIRGAYNKMKNLSDRELNSYLSKIETKTLLAYGVYQIEAKGIELFDYIKGDRDSIMGLPIREILKYIDQYKEWKENLE